MKIDKSWKQELSEEFEKEYFKSLIEFVKSEYKTFPDRIFPKENQIFRALDTCSFDDVKVVILGQDPYPTRGHAHGLCFSVESDVRPLPKSLNNIYKELESDLGISRGKNGDLAHWSEQGVLLLNSVLTVREGQANSHKGKGWEIFTDSIIQKLSEKREGIVYVLWGAKAQEKGKTINSSNNKVICAPHPSPLSSYRGFFGSKPFSQTDDYLIEQGLYPIQW